MRALFRARRGNAGFTLVEVLVATTILGVVLSLTTGVIIRAMDQNSNLTQESEAQNRNNIGMEELTRALRQAVFPTNGTNQTSTIITTATSTQVTFTTRLSSTAAASTSSMGTPVQFTAQFNTTKHTLVWGTGAENACTAPTVCTYATPTLSKTLVYGVRNDGGSTVCPADTSNSPVFQYWYTDPTGNLAAWVSGTNTLSQISTVQINLWTQTQTGPQQPACVNLTDYVQLRNWQ